MSVYPPVWVPLVKTGYYPHMAKLDAALWERFIDLYGANFSLVAYDVAFGGFVPDADLGPEAQRLGYQYSTAMKVDAIAQRPDEVWIIEVKPSGASSALGAALTYTLLAERDSFSPFPLVPVVVTDTMHPDAKYAAELLNVVIVEVGIP
jgi:hypothetical protein